MNNTTCDSGGLKVYQHYLYGVVYSVILAPGLLGNVLAIWVFRAFIRETKKAVVFMMNLAVADLLQVLSLPLRIYYYLNDTWPFGHFLCMTSFYLKYVNMYASIYFLVCISVRRCELIIRPLAFHSSRRRGDLLVCGFGWLLVCLCCLPFPLLRSLDPNGANSTQCFAELATKPISPLTVGAIIVTAELGGFVIPLILVLACAVMSTWTLRETRAGPIPDTGEKQRALRMVLSCVCVFLVCFLPYHITMPLDFLIKAKALTDCSLKRFILRCHPVTLCLASLNCSLDPIMYYFTTDEFWRRLSKSDVPDSVPFSRRRSCTSGGDDD